MGRLDRLKGFIDQCKRVLIVANKPDLDEYKSYIKISAIGIAIIGVIGFAIFMVVQIIGGL
ncbi:MAG: protein translocase SEC61 complex subunit gamma [Candidatus Aenigmarchaeota archaeon]|nr:protein translocase SEC61 complex subunit gamma [Candidatus Aenigmarchaeota archaeon]